MEMNEEILHKYTKTITSSGVTEMFKDIKDKLTWKPNEVILDIGCGPGDVPANVLPKFISADSKIVAVDISENQIAMAKKLYSNSGITFDIMDITDSNLWAKWKKESYDRIFCTYVMQRIIEDKKSYENMFNLLKPGGEIIITYPVNSSVLDMARYLAKLPKYKDYEKELSELQITINPRDDMVVYMNDLFKNIGFDIMLCNLQTISTEISSQDEIIEIMSLTTPLRRILPKELFEEVLIDARTIMDKYPLFKKTENGFQCEYFNLLLLAKKPNKI